MGTTLFLPLRSTWPATTSSIRGRFALAVRGALAAIAGRSRTFSKWHSTTQHRANIAFADDHIASPLCSQQSPGHCANNDPQSFRVAVPYFTYQLKANKKIVTTGVCAR